MIKEIEEDRPRKKERIYIFFNNVDIFHKRNQFRKDGPKPERKKRAPKQEKKQERRKRNNMVGHHKGIKGVGANRVLKTNVALT